MCGIVGVFTTDKMGLFKKHGDLFHDLLLFDVVRGAHGTGAFAVDGQKNTVAIAKAACGPLDFLCDPAGSYIVDEASKYNALIGHNRYATRGAHSDENSHPFNEGKITLVHNGTLHHHKSLADVEVDSHAICHALSQSDDSGEVLNSLSGAFALVWYDQESNQLHFARNSQRPLHLISFGFNGDKTSNTYVLSSEHEIAYAAISRNGYKVSSAEGSIKLLDPEYMYSVSMNEKNAKLYGKKWKKASVYPVAVKSNARESESPKEDHTHKKPQNGGGRTTATTRQHKHIGIDAKGHVSLDGITWGKEILFRIEDFKESDKQPFPWKVLGSCCTTGIEVYYYCDDDELSQLMNYPTARGVIYSIRETGKNSIEYVTVNNVTPEFSGVDRYQRPFHSKDLPGFGDLFCQHCDRPLTYDDLKTCSVNIKAGGKTKITCDSCCELFMEANKELRESSSNHTH